MKENTTGQCLGFRATLSLLHRHKMLATRRSVLSGEGKGAKIFLWVMTAIAVVYLAFVGLMMAFIIVDDRSINAYEFTSGVLPFVLLADFIFRFIFRKMPVQEVIPYLLLPLSKYSCTDCLLIEDLLSPYNLLLQAFFLPIGVITVLPHYGIVAFIGFHLALQLVIEINSQWHLLVRALTGTSLLWWIPAGVIYAIEAIPFFLGKGGINSFCDFYASIGQWLSVHQLVLWSALAGVLGLFFIVNRKVQHFLVRDEITAKRSSGSSMKFLSSLFSTSVSFLSAGSMTKAYLRLEVISMFRNKNLRKNFFASVAIIIGISALLSFTDFFDDRNFQIFWILYCFNTFAAMLLVKIMCYEGNYIDCIAVNPDSLSSILKGKYVFFVVILIIPLVALLPTVFTGVMKFSELLAYALFAAGLTNFGYFQLAVYNNTSYTLNEKATGKHSTVNNFTQMVASLIIFTVPMSLIILVEGFFGRATACILMVSVGILLIILSPLWLRNIVKRMKARKYINLEGFRS